jgi:hypothetical protein
MRGPSFLGAPPPGQRVQERAREKPPPVALLGRASVARGGDAEQLRGVQGRGCPLPLRRAPPDPTGVGGRAVREIAQRRGRARVKDGERAASRAPGGEGCVQGVVEQALAPRKEEHLVQAVGLEHIGASLHPVPGVVEERSRRSDQRPQRPLQGATPPPREPARAGVAPARLVRAHANGARGPAEVFHEPAPDCAHVAVRPAQAQARLVLVREPDKQRGARAHWGGGGQRKATAPRAARCRAQCRRARRSPRGPPRRFRSGAGSPRVRCTPARPRRPRPAGEAPPRT